jgi:hypothetical protein
MDKQASSANPFAQLLWWIMWILTAIPAGIGRIFQFETVMDVREM